MFSLEDFVDLVLHKGCGIAVCNTYVTVVTFDENKVLWAAKLRDLSDVIENYHNSIEWFIVEIAVDYNRDGEEMLPPQNKAKIIKVI